MKNTILFFSFFIASLTMRADNISFFKEADVFFKKYVHNGGVKYKAINADQESLNRLVEQIASTRVESFDKKSQKAFYLNAYNILVIKGIIAKYPINSPMDVDGFFDKQTHNLAGTQITLNDIENKIIRPQFKDSRIHFALVCAAKGCPKIAGFAFSPEKVEQQLQQLAVNAMNNTQFTRVEKENKKVLLSEIFNWYKDDFIAEAPNLLSYVNKYRSIKIDANFSVGNYTYNWKLNEAEIK